MYTSLHSILSLNTDLMEELKYFKILTQNYLVDSEAEVFNCITSERGIWIYSFEAKSCIVSCNCTWPCVNKW